MAMKFAEKFLNMMTLNDADDEYDEYEDEYEEVEDDYDDYDDYDDESEESDDEEDFRKPILSFRHKMREIEEKREEFEDRREPQEEIPRRVIPFHQVKRGEGDIVKVIKPQEFNEAQTIVDYLKEGKTIVVNLEGIEISQAQRIIDFIGGASFIIDGSLKAISNNIFIVAPGNIEVSGDLKSEIINDTMISPELGTI